MKGSSVFQDDWERLQEIVEGRSEYGRGTLAVTEARNLAAAISHEHGVAVTIPQTKLKWLKGGRDAQ